MRNGIPRIQSRPLHKMALLFLALSFIVCPGIDANAAQPLTLPEMPEATMPSALSTSVLALNSGTEAPTSAAPEVTAAPQATQTAEPTQTPVPTATPQPDTMLPETAMFWVQETATPAPVVTPEPLPEAKYVGIAQTNIAIRTDMSRDADSVGSFEKSERVMIVDYEPEWLYVVKGSEEKWVSGYVLRHTVSDISTRNAGDMPYGSTPGQYSAVLGSDTLLYNQPSESGDPFFTLTEGTKVAILEIKDGWAKVIYWRSYGYFYLDALSLIHI